jgi:hypothetical protein
MVCRTKSCSELSGEGENMQEREEELRRERVQSFDVREQEELKKETLKRLRDAVLALDKWKRDSLASQFRY